MAKIAYSMAEEGREHLFDGGTTTSSIGSGSGGPTSKLKEKNNNWVLPALLIAFVIGVI